MATNPFPQNKSSLCAFASLRQIDENIPQSREPRKVPLIKSSTNISLLDRNALIALGCVVAVAVVMLNIEGRRWWCPAGDLSPWSWDIWSQHNSQHLVDPYSFTHILHGVLEFWLLSLLF